jgi:SH3 domain protein
MEYDLRPSGKTNSHKDMASNSANSPMIRLKTKKILISLFSISVAGNAAAETRYVVDKLIITMRSGQSTQHKIIKHWPSNTKLEILEAGEKYSLAKGPDGTEGWVLNQYMTSTPTAKLKLAVAQNKLAKLTAENNRLKEEMNKISTKEANVSKDHKSLTRSSKKQADELAHLRRVAAKPLKLENENQRMKKEFLDLENEHTLLSQETQMLRDSSDREWFLNGAGVIIVGIIIGLIAPRLRMRKKSSWGSL